MGPLAAGLLVAATATCAADPWRAARRGIRVSMIVGILSACTQHTRQSLGWSMQHLLAVAVMVLLAVAVMVVVAVAVVVTVAVVTPFRATPRRG